MPQHESLADDCLAGGGEMGALMRSMDWAKTPLGPAQAWSPALRTVVRLMLANRLPMLLWWGPQYISIYNDPYRPVLGNKHPWGLGQPVSECWKEIWHVLQPLIDTPYHGGPATWDEDILLVINRHGFPEETHWLIAYSPVPDEGVPGGIGGVLATVHEITGKVVGERRVVVLRDLGAQASEAKTAQEACATAAKTLAAHDKDIPFALIYLLSADGKHAELAAASGVASGESISTLVVGLDVESRSGWPLAEAVEANSALVVSDLAARFESVPPGPWSDLPNTAVVLPIPSTRAHLPAGLLVAGVSARLRLDEQYRGFLELVAGQIGNAVATARAYEEEKMRAEALAELDRAKTAFFSNVSHEFRTPLTLMLGPVEDALADAAEPLPAKQRERLETAHRSSLRLLKLVNTLLDFARIEAGRVQAVYEPTDLAALTAELASNFRSACEKVGLRLVVDCPPLLEPVWVDQDMWEKVVLNLLSNAFKFTFEGEIAVRLRAVGAAVELSVCDTGTGIPAAELPRIFERFHRVEAARGRTHEGTGIGLALVQELVKLHGGAVGVESIYGQGSAFTVSVSTGTAHLPADRIGAARTLGSTAVGAGAFIEEALRWLVDDETSRSFPGSVGNAREAFPPEGVGPGRSNGTPGEEEEAGPRPRILWADDNADMRDYVRRLLGKRYDVEAVPDGAAALAAARARPPDLVLSDVMMPHLDGFGLLNALRADPATRTIPVILLSARAGEESRVEGLQAGADDYLVKPFSARELLARVGANLEMSRVRREAGEQITYLMESIPDGLVVLDSEWRYTFVNAPAEHMLGRLRSELVGRCVWDVFPDAVDTEEERQLRLVASEQVTREFQGYHAEWGRWYENRAFPMPEGGVAVYFRDVTERQRAESALRQSEERFRGIFDQTVAGIAETDLTGRFTHVNSRYCEIVGRTAEELYGLRMTDITHPDDLPRNLELFHRMIRSAVPFVIEKRYVKPDGSHVWVSNSVSLLCTTGEPNSTVAVSLEITDRKRAEKALRQSEERFRHYFELGLIGMAITSPSKGFVEVNDEICKILGYERDEILRKTWAEMTHSGDLATEQTHFNRVLVGEIDGYALEKRWIRKDGQVVDSVIAVKCVRLDDGSVDYFVGLLQDVTERQRAEDVLRESEERFRNMADRAPVKIWVTDADGLCTYLNERWCRFTGTTPEQGLGNGWLESVHPDDREPVWVGFRAANEQRSAFNPEYRLRRHDGVYRWVIESAVPRFGPAGEFLGFIGSVLDVSERKQAEEVVRASEQQLIADLAGMVRLQAVSTRLVHDGGDPVPLLQEIVDAAIAVTAADMGNIQLLGRASGVLEIVASRGFGSPFLDFFATVHDGQAACGHAMRSGERVIVEDVIQSPIFVNTPALDALLAAGVRAVQSTPLVARSGRIVGMLSTYYCTPRRPADRDLHNLDLLARQAADWIERARGEEELRQAKEVAEAANRSKDEFLANVSHEIRTPLNAVLGMTELVLDTSLADDQRQCLETVKSAADNLLIVINDLLDFSKIAAGKMELDAGDFSLRTMLNETLRALALRAHIKGLELACHVPSGVPDALIGDAGRLKQVLLNLVGNAIKFTEQGEVVIRVDVAASNGADQKLPLRFAVSDTGIGISPDKQKRIFSAFEQEDTSTTRRYGGTGLGLTIATQLVSLMEGTITVDSELGRGSTFEFTISLAQQLNPKSPEAPSFVSLRDLSVLIVDDNATNRHILEEWLNDWQMKPSAVASAAAALDALVHAAGTGQPYVLVLLDAQMPEMDGLMLAAKIRELPSLSATRIILLTSGDRPKDLAQLRELQIDANLLKPIPPHELFETIYRIVGREKVESRPMSKLITAGAPAAPPLRILVAEDNEFNSRHLERLLDRAGHSVQLAPNGRKALDKLQDEYREIDVLLLDLHMPELDGFQVIATIRQRERLSGGHLPVIALTARSRTEDREQCLAAGMDHFLVKPVRAEELLAAIDSLVSARRAPPHSLADGERDLSLIDRAVLLAACGKDADALRELCQDFRVYAPERLAELTVASRDQDLPRLSEAAHKFCGLLSAFSTVAGSAASDLEDFAAAGRLEDAQSLVTQLERIVQQLLEQVDGLSLESLQARPIASQDYRQ